MSKEAQPLDNRTPPTEEEIRAYTIGELKPLSSRILIVDYDPHWPDLFAREADRIRSLLGSRALRIEHAGSTSVPGLAAKPIIDLLLVVMRTLRPWRRLAMCSGSESQTGTSTGCSRGRTRISTCTCFHPAVPKSTTC